MMGVIRMAGSDEWFMRVRRCDALPFVSLFLELSRKCYVLSTISYVKEHRNVTPILTLLSLSISPSLHENGLSERILKYQTTLEFNDAPVTGREIAKRENQRHTGERVGKHAGKTAKQEEKKLRKGENKNNEKEREREGEKVREGKESSLRARKQRGSRGSFCYSLRRKHLSFWWRVARVVAAPNGRTTIDK